MKKLLHCIAPISVVLFGVVAAPSGSFTPSIVPGQQIPMGFEPPSKIHLQANAISQTIPARFQGQWVGDRQYCDRLSDTKLRITANRIDFWESVGTVLMVKTEGDSDLAVAAQFTSEGETWTNFLRFRLSNNQQTLTTIYDDNSQFIRQRCS